MTATTDARTEIVAALTAAGLVAYGYTPAAVIPPVIILEPDNPWLEPNRIGPDFAAAMHLTARVVVQAVDVTSSLDSLEALVEATVVALPPGLRISQVDAPEQYDTGSQGSALAAAIHLSAQIKETP